MALKSDYSIYVKIHNDQHKVIHSYETKAFRSCQQDLKFAALQTGMLGNNGFEPEMYMSPLWKKGLGQPFCEGFQISLGSGNNKISKNYTVAVLQNDIFREINILKSNGVIDNTMVQVNYSVYAYPRQMSPSEQTKGIDRSTIKLTVRSKPFPVKEKNILDVEKMIKEGKPNQNKSILPVFVRENVLQNISRRCLYDTSNEQAGLLLGKLFFDSKKKQHFLVCSTIIEAKPDQSSSPDSSGKNNSIAHFSFTPELFISLQKQVTNKSDELIAGWYHSHPWIFNETTKVKTTANNNELNSVFFSTDDQIVQDTAFSLPYQVALVFGGVKATKTSKPAPAVQMFGWSAGLIVPRNFFSI